MRKRPFSLSAYTTTYNCYEMEYPFEQCIDSLLGFADEVVVADAGSTDGTIEALERMRRQDSRLKYTIAPVDFSHPRWAIYQDGYLKAKARALCSGDYCWQIDTDEIVPPEDYPKMDTLPQLLAGHELLMLPMVEFWGSFNRIRADFFTMKPRFSVNNPRITHGIPHRFRMYDESGHEYPKPYDSDSCNYIYTDTLLDVPIHSPIVLTREEQLLLQHNRSAALERIFFRSLDELPGVLHVSWLDFPRKIRHYKRFWHAFHASMYNHALGDTPETNAMFDKPWAEVTEEDIAEKSAQLERIGPRSFHKKIDPHVIGPTYVFTRPIPPPLREWAERTARPPVNRVPPPEPQRASIATTSWPFISAIVPSYKKAPYLRQSIGSLASQDYPHIEILVINDGSPDNTSEVVRELSRELPSTTIHLLEKQNGGISDARNYGITHARGSHLLFLDGDDIAKQGFVSAAVERIVNHNNNLISTNVEIFGASTGEWFPNPYSESAIRYDNSIPTLAVVERQLWERTGGFNVCFPFIEDWNFWINVSRLRPSVYRLPERFFLYRSSEDGLAHLFMNSYRECLALVMTANEDLYTIDELLWAHSMFHEMRPGWIDRFKRQDVLHPTQWLLKFWLALFAQRQGHREEALTLYQKSVELSCEENWQPLLRLAELLQQGGKVTESLELLRKAIEAKPQLRERLSGQPQQAA